MRLTKEQILRAARDADYSTLRDLDEGAYIVSGEYKRPSRGKGIIVGRRAPMLQLCPTCGQMRIHHPHRKLYVCPVSKEVIDSIRAFKRAHGPQWKAKLKEMWKTGRVGAMRYTFDTTAPLLQAKELIGPRRLYKIKLD